MILYTQRQGHALKGQEQNIEHVAQHGQGQRQALR